MINEYKFEVKFTVNIEAESLEEAQEKASCVEIIPTSGVFEDINGFEYNQI